MWLSGVMAACFIEVDDVGFGGLLHRRKLFRLSAVMGLRGGGSHASQGSLLVFLLPSLSHQLAEILFFFAYRISLLFSALILPQLSACLMSRIFDVDIQMMAQARKLERRMLPYSSNY